MGPCPLPQEHFILCVCVCVTPHVCMCGPCILGHSFVLRAGLMLLLRV